jgi:hypothetical protein
MHRLLWAALLLAPAAAGACFNSANDCDTNKGACVGQGGGASSSTTTTMSSVSSSGAAGAGAGGGAPCGGTCKDPTPQCDVASMKCVACLADSDCKTPEAARCVMGVCTKCNASTQCKDHPGTTICDTTAGKCVECNLGEETTCSTGKTCDLVAKKCVAVGPGTVKNCEACTNDVQCEQGAACVALNFKMQPHGHFCLKAASPTCPSRPFQVPLMKPSISGKATATYCGINEDEATCQAVNAMVAGWVCPSNKDGMCGPMNMPEVAVPGALCKTVGVAPSTCTYSCASTPECPNGPIQGTCGTGTKSPPGWCGG